jgi:RNA polymerase sigma-70 factor (ECF subfamily)
MSRTDVSLLERLRLCPDAPSWKRLVDLYTPLIRGWLHRHGTVPADVDDLVQEVMTVVVRELPGFHHDGRPGAFRRWLRTVTVNRLRALWRARRSQPVATGDSDFVQMLDQLEAPDSPLSQLWDQEHDRYVARQLLEMAEPDFEPTTWRAARRLLLEDAKAATVAAELKISVNAVLLAKSRVLRRLRQEVAGLLD